MHISNETAAFPLFLRSKNVVLGYSQ